MTTPKLPQTNWLALDVGGANIKAAHSRGEARSRPFQLWKQPEHLPGILKNLVSTLPPFDNLALTMTAELCDCYANKAEGVTAIVESALSLTAPENIHVWGTDGDFHTVPSILAQPAQAAAANWLALATLAARFAAKGSGILIDIGSTTTDLIPLVNQKPSPQGRTDTERLRSGELIYAGVRRTPVCALGHEVVWRGAPTGLCAELFATTHDVYLTTGDCDPDPSDHQTADGRPATVQAARDRLARMVGADRETFSTADANELAGTLDSMLLDRLILAGQRVLGSNTPCSAVISGSGQFLARRVARGILPPEAPIIDLAAVWGPRASDAACAQALLILAAETIPLSMRT